MSSAATCTSSSTPLADSTLPTTDDKSSTPVVEIPQEYTCPITQELMVDPVISRYGQSYERKAIIEWLASGTHDCPLTRQPLSLANLVTNHRLRAQIEGWCDRQGMVSPIEAQKQLKRLQKQKAKQEQGGSASNMDEEESSDEEEFVCHAFLDLPGMLGKAGTAATDGSTDRLSDDGEELTEVRVRRVVVVPPSVERQSNTNRSNADTAEQQQKRQSFLSRWRRRASS